MAASTNAANNVALFLSTVSSYTGITAAATQSNANGIIQFLGTSTAAITSRGGVINANAADQRRFVQLDVQHARIPAPGFGGTTRRAGTS